MRSFCIKFLLLVIGLVCLLGVAKAKSYPGEGASSWVVEADTFTAPATQLANQLLARTQPGYYSNQVVIDAHLTATCSADLCGKPNVPMPVKLIKFSGQRLDATQVQLNWTTSAESNNDYFGVQRSTNPAAGFETIGSVKGKGNSAENVTYQFADPNTETGYTYYRLKQVDFDGTFAYSQIIAIKGYSEELTVKAFPNPGFQKDLTFQVSGVKSGESLSVSVFDARGVALYQNTNYVLGANQQIFLSTLPSLRAGSYYVQIKTSHQQASTTFIINH